MIFPSIVITVISDLDIARGLYLHMAAPSVGPINSLSPRTDFGDFKTRINIANACHQVWRTLQFSVHLTLSRDKIAAHCAFMG